MSISNSNPRSVDNGRCIALPDGGLRWFESAFREQADSLLAELAGQVEWQQHRLRLFGRDVSAPRLSAWYADDGCDYRYSGLQLVAQPFSIVLDRMRADIESLTGYRFNSVLLNLYRNGEDSMGWHSDDEPELGPAPVIASVSLGATRRFLLRHRRDRSVRFSLDLTHGSLLLMEPPLQAFWQHSVAKTRRAVGARINLTWRSVVG